MELLQSVFTIYFVPLTTPPPPKKKKFISKQSFVQNNLGTNSDMYSAEDTPPVHKKYHLDFDWGGSSYS
jgi:hypothetical protein